MAEKFKACSVDGCNGNAHSSSNGRKGFCCAHYKRNHRHGNPLWGATPPGEPERFYQNVVLQYDGDDCLAWPYSRGGHGYGTLSQDGKMELVSRLVCKEINGHPPTAKHEAAHSCGNGKLGCVTKGHLSWKMHRENEADKITHGTHNRGERHGMAKLTEMQVREILSLKGEFSQHQIAAKYGVSHGAVGLIHKGRNWAWLSA